MFQTISLPIIDRRQADGVLVPAQAGEAVREDLHWSRKLEASNFLPKNPAQEKKYGIQT